MNQRSSQNNKDFSQAKARVKGIKNIARTSRSIPVSGPDLVVLEESWTRFLLAVIRFGNRHFMKSLKYRLREAEPDELEKGEATK